jgi:hypothetical protein
LADYFLFIAFGLALANLEEDCSQLYKVFSVKIAVLKMHRNIYLPCSESC